MIFLSQRVLIKNWEAEIESIINLGGQVRHVRMRAPHSSFSLEFDISVSDPNINHYLYINLYIYLDNLDINTCFNYNDIEKVETRKEWTFVQIGLGSQESGKRQFLLHNYTVISSFS